VQGRQGDAVQLLALIVTVAKSDLTILESFQATVANGHAKDVAPQILKHLLALTCRLTIHHPLFAPERARRLAEQAGPFQRGTELGPEDQCQRPFRHQEGGVLRRPPLFAAGGEPPAGDEHMNVGVIKHGPGPGVQHGQSPQPPAQVTLI
jgi:hypothetical protein